MRLHQWWRLMRPTTAAATVDMDPRMDPDYRLMRVFLSENGVFEVYVNIPKKIYVCTCPGFRARAACKHEAAVAERVRATNGFGMVMADGASPPTDELMADAMAFRQWVIHNAKVETLDDAGR